MQKESEWQVGFQVRSGECQILYVPVRGEGVVILSMDCDLISANCCPNHLLSCINVA